MTYKRDLAKEYREHGSTPEQKKRRAARNAARNAAIKAGKVKKGDGKEIDHKNFNALDNRPSNLRVVDKKTNRTKQPKRGGKK
jgi:hypothetical protein